MKLTIVETLIFFKRIPMFSDLDIEELFELKDISSEREYKNGEEIITEGESGNEAFIIADGMVEILKDSKIITTLEKGDYFGEMAIIENEPRSATAISKGNSLLLVLDGDSFRKMIVSNSNISFNLVKVLSNRIRELISKKKA